MASKCDEEEISFTNQVVKDNFVFPLFLVKSNVFRFALNLILFRFFPTFLLFMKEGTFNVC